MHKLMIGLSVGLAASVCFAQQPGETDATPQIDYAAFANLTRDLAEVRSTRLLGREAFFGKASAPDAILLDTRSAAAFEQGHIAGAVNLPFSDFTEDALREVLGDDRSRPIFIYCNNNFSDNVAPIPLKKAPLALNIPTFINLYGYGYTNIWELAGVMPVSEVAWVSQNAGPELAKEKGGNP